MASADEIRQSLAVARGRRDAAGVVGAGWALARRLIAVGDLTGVRSALDEVQRAAELWGDDTAAEAALAAVNLCETLCSIDSATTEIEAAHQRLLALRQTERSRVAASLRSLVNAWRPSLAGPDAGAGNAWGPGEGAGYGAVVLPFSLGIVEVRLPFSLRGARRELRVRCLGRFEVELDGVVLPPWRNNRSRLVFAYLLLNRREPVSRHRLMGLFWPEHSEERAENNLSLAVMAARRLFDGARPRGDRSASLIRSVPGAYAIDLDCEVWLDTESFLDAAELGRRCERSGDLASAAAALDRAIGLYGGEFLPADVYEDWTAETRQHLQDGYVDALIRRGRLARLCGDFELSIEVNRQALAVDSCLEEAHRQVMLDCWRLGQRNRALRQMDLCRQALEAGLGVEPEAETIAVYRRILGVA